METKAQKFNMAYAQGLAYAWGRNDAEIAYWGNRGARIVDSVEFATAWAEVVREDGSRPDLGGAFEAFRDGRPIREGRRVWE